MEAADDGYRVSGLESGSQEPAVPSVDPNSVPSESSHAENPVQTPPVTSETLLKPAHLFLPPGENGATVTSVSRWDMLVR